MKKRSTVLYAVLSVSALAACKPSTPRVDPLAQQHDAMNKARALQGQLQQQADQRMKATDESR